MTCANYEMHELGKLDEKSFNAHIAQCLTCRTLIHQDEDLLKAAGSINREVRAPFLWSRIENRLKKEQNRRHRFSQRISTAFSHPAIRIAASVVIMIGIWVGVLLLREQETDAKLLTKNALKRVERMEQQHRQAIAELGQLVQPKLGEMELELSLLYRDRLETIDDQITRCHEALEDNPANAHIRRYLLAALQDKKETIAEIINFKS